MGRWGEWGTGNLASESYCTHKVFGCVIGVLYLPLLTASRGGREACRWGAEQVPWDFPPDSLVSGIFYFFQSPSNHYYCADEI
jgi:hypothetical protein